MIAFAGVKGVVKKALICPGKRYGVHVTTNFGGAARMMLIRTGFSTGIDISGEWVTYEKTKTDVTLVVPNDFIAGHLVLERYDGSRFVPDESVELVTVAE